MRLVARSALFLIGCVACSAQQAGQATSEDSLQAGPPPAAAVFAPATKRLVLEIDYALGAEPFVGTAPDPWKIFRDNAAAMLGSNIEVVVPGRLEEMERIDDIDASTFGGAELRAIAKKHRNTATTDDTVSVYVLFLDGQFKNEDGRVAPNTVGVSVRGTGIIAMFKPAITVGIVDPTMAMHMEQTTLVHEFGHAIGLVGEGIPATSAHRDDAHGAHCRNPACIMYFRNDMVKEGVDFVSEYLTPRNGILFGPECLADAHALAAKPGGTFASLVGHPTVASTTEPAETIIDERTR
jgi:hypothetical protein